MNFGVEKQEFSGGNMTSSEDFFFFFFYFSPTLSVKTIVSLGPNISGAGGRKGLVEMQRGN